MALTLTSTQECDVSVTFKDAHGNPAQIDGEPAWTVSDESILSLASGANANQVTVAATGKIGNAQLRMMADALPGAEVEQIIGILEVDVVAGKAITAEMTAGVPREQA